MGAGGVVLVPYWQGCMTPHWDSAARGVIAGLSGSTRRGDVYRALLEGIALDQSRCPEPGSRGDGSPIDHYVAIGGGASTDFWPQILADVTARPVRRSTAIEASSLGAAMAAATGAGWYPGLSQAAAAMASRTVGRSSRIPAGGALRRPPGDPLRPLARPVGLEPPALGVRRGQPWMSRPTGTR